MYGKNPKDNFGHPGRVGSNKLPGPVIRELTQIAEVEKKTIHHVVSEIIEAWYKERKTNGDRRFDSAPNRADGT